MNATLLEVLQNANAIEILTRILDEQSSGQHSTVCFLILELLGDLDLIYVSRKWQITFSRHATTFAA